MKGLRLIVPVVVLAIVFPKCEAHSFQTGALPFVGLAGRATRTNVLTSSASGFPPTKRKVRSLSSHTRATLTDARGGDISCCDKLTAASCSATLFTINDAVMVLAPDVEIKARDLVPAPAIRYQARNGGLHGCTASFVIWCLLWTKTSVNRAVGMATLVSSVLRGLHCFFAAGAPTRFGTATDYAGLIFSSVVIYTTLTNHADANVAIKGLGLVLLLQGLGLICFPKNSSTSTRHLAKKKKPDDDCSAFFSIRYPGGRLVLSGVLFTALGMGHNIFMAFWFSLLAGTTYEWIADRIAPSRTHKNIPKKVLKPLEIVCVVVVLSAIVSPVYLLSMKACRRLC